MTAGDLRCGLCQEEITRRCPVAYTLEGKPVCADCHKRMVEDRLRRFTRLKDLGLYVRAGQRVTP